MVDERTLHRMQLVRLGEPLYGRHLTAFHGRRQHHAAVHTPPVEQHRAGTALATVASLLGAGQVEALAQQVEQRHADVDPGKVVIGAVDAKVEVESLDERHRAHILEIAITLPRDGLLAQRFASATKAHEHDRPDYPPAAIGALARSCDRRPRAPVRPTGSRRRSDVTARRPERFWSARPAGPRPGAGATDRSFESQDSLAAQGSADAPRDGPGGPRTRDGIRETGL